MKRKVVHCIMGVWLVTSSANQAADLGTAFTYQGYLENPIGTPVDGPCDFEFSLWDADAMGTQIAATQTVLSVPVTAGVFTVGPPNIDFGEGAFDGKARWLAIKVQCPGDAAFVALSPRQTLTAAPYALQTRGLLVNGEGLHVEGNVLAGDHVVGFGDPGGISPENYMVVGSDDLNQSVGLIIADMDGIQDSRVWMVLDAAAKRLDLTHGWSTGGDLDYFFNRNKLAILQGGTDGQRVMTIGGPDNRVGIGTSTPATTLEVTNLSGAAVARITSGNTTNGTILELKNNTAAPTFLGSVRFMDAGGVAEGRIAYKALDDSMSFSTDAVERMWIDSTGRVGIGTNSPDAQLHVKSTTARGVLGEGSLGYAGVKGSNNDLGGGYGVIGIAEGTTGLNYGVYGNSASLSGYGVYSDGRMRATGNLICDGSVGIGTDSPEAPLHVQESSAGVVTAQSNSIAVFERNGQGFVSILTPDASERGILFGDPSNAANGGIIFNNSSVPDGFQFRTGGNVTQMVITSAGDVGIGDATPDVALDVVGSITYTGTITGVSDRRLKDNITAVQNALAKVRQLDGVYFNMKETPEEREVGLIAQNVRDVLPEAVRVIDREGGYLGVSYPSLIPLLVEAIKEMESEFNARNACREQEINDLRSRVEALELACAGSVVRAGLPLALIGLVALVALRRRSVKGGVR